MLSRITRALVLMMLMAGPALVPGAAASAEEPADTTPPQINLNPCYEGTSCRRVYAEVFGDLQEGDDLAVLGARIGDTVVAEHVYDDGTGFVPHGSFSPYGSDVYREVDYALSVEVPRGTSDITFYARDLEGNISELTTAVLGPIPPGPVRRLRAVLFRAHTSRVTWALPDLKGSAGVRCVVRTPGRTPKSTFSGPPSFHPGSVYFRRLSVGWHRFTVRAHTVGGVGPARTVRLYVPRQPR